MPRAHNEFTPPNPGEVAALEYLELRLNRPGLTFTDSLEVLTNTKPLPEEETLTGMKLVHLVHLGGSGFAPVETSLQALQEARRTVEASPSFQNIGLRSVSDAMDALSRRALVDPSMYPVAREAARIAYQVRQTDPTAEGADSLHIAGPRWLGTCIDPDGAARREIADPVERGRLAQLEKELNRPGQTPSAAMHSLIYFDPGTEYLESRQQKVGRIIALSSFAGISPSTALEGLQNAHFEVDFGPRMKPEVRDELADAFTALARRTEKNTAHPGIAADAVKHARDCRSGVKMRWFDPACGGC